MRKLRTLGAVLLILLTGTNLAAQQNGCDLLTAADIQALTGETPGQPHTSNTVIDKGPQKGQTMHWCMWGPGSNESTVTAMLAPAPTGAARDSGIATIRHAYDQLKAQHWTEEKQDFANGSCTTMVPPAGVKDVPIASQCYAEVKGIAVAVGFMSPTKKLTLAQMKALLDRAVAHLP